MKNAKSTNYFNYVEMVKKKSDERSNERLAEIIIATKKT